MDAEDLRRRRDALGWSQEKLAHALGVTRQSVYMWERGKTPVPALLHRALCHVEIEEEARARGVEPAALLRERENG